MLLLVLLCSVVLVCVIGGSPNGSDLLIINKAFHPVDVFWVSSPSSIRFEDIKESELVKLSTEPIDSLMETQFNSFDTHRFIFRYSNHVESAQVQFTKGPNDETLTLIGDETQSYLRIKFDTPSVSGDLSEKVVSATRSCLGLKGDEYMACVIGDIETDFKHVSDSKERLTTFYGSVSHHLRNYTCKDPTIESTNPIFDYDYVSPSVPEGQKNTWKVNVHLDSSHAKIWTVDNFITDDECKVLMDHGRPKLRRATVAAEDGTSIVSENRKAQQASYDYTGDEDPLTDVYHRTLELANYHTGYHMDMPGQESFTIIQYNPDDQYTPHCDSSCDGTEHLKGGRVATAVLYCKVADTGGATTFVRSNVFVKPKNGSATFFAYMGPDKMMDPMMLTEHSGCPVIEGEKWITTFWMREGVTEADPWTAYDPSGVRMMTASDDEEGEVSTPESSETSVDGSSVDDTTTVAVSNETTELQSAIDEL